MNNLDVNSCRICFATNATISLFDETGKLNIASLLEAAINIKLQPNEHASNLICSNCLQLINTSLQFKKDVEQAEIRWNNYLVYLFVVKDEEKFQENSELIKCDEPDSDGNDDSKIEAVYGQDDEIEPKINVNNVRLTDSNKSKNKRNKPKAEEKERICGQCGKEFRSHANLLNHIRTHTGEKPFECDVCSRRFSQSGNLIIHQRNHKNWKPYVCEICSKQFTQIGNLQQHMFTHKANREFKCPECSKSFQHKTSLKIHLATHSGIKNHICGSCNKSFFRTNSLNKHIRTVHYKEKRHICIECDKAFSNTSNLQAHFRIHTGEKPFECKYCDAKFNQSSPLVRHMRQHTKNNDQLKAPTANNQID